MSKVVGSRLLVVSLMRVGRQEVMTPVQGMVGTDDDRLAAETRCRVQGRQLT